MVFSEYSKSQEDSYGILFPNTLNKDDDKSLQEFFKLNGFDGK